MSNYDLGQIYGKRVKGKNGEKGPLCLRCRNVSDAREHPFLAKKVHPCFPIYINNGLFAKKNTNFS